MAVDTMLDLLVCQLRDLHSAERQVLDAWPHLAARTTARSLRLALEVHQDDTARHILRLEKALELLDAPLTGHHSTAMQRLITEARANADNEPDPAFRDALILGDCQRVEGYEIAMYATARVFAEALGHSEIVSLLERTLTEEEVADAILTQIDRHEVRPGSQRLRRARAAAMATTMPVLLPHEWRPISVTV